MEAEATRTRAIREPTRTRTTGRSARSQPGVNDDGQSRLRLLRYGAFFLLLVVVGGVALGLLIGRLQAPGSSDPSAVRIETTMGGFTPSALTANAGQTVRVDLVNRDSPYHSDGGGIHSFHIDSLNVHQNVDPESDKVFSFTAPATPGTYDFYCDTCCGGKENPAMHGTLTVTA